MQKIINFLMFNGNAEETMNFYISLFPNSDNGTVLMPLGAYPFSKNTPGYQTSLTYRGN